ncbi:MAG TPA: hypothetical protein VIF57_27000 [Polyangia bacterium]
MHEQRREGFRTVSKVPPPGALSRARALVLGVAPLPLANSFDDWASMAGLCDTGWLLASLRPSVAITRIAQRRLRALTARPLAFAEFAAQRPGHGPLHLRGTCAPLPGQDATRAVWRLEVDADADLGRVLVEEGNDFLLSLEGGGQVYVLSRDGHLVSGAPLRAGDTVSVFGFADAIPDAIGLAASPNGRGGLLHAIRSGSELPLLVTKVVR